jgi:hypothetical protein
MQMGRIATRPVWLACNALRLASLTRVRSRPARLACMALVGGVAVLALAGVLSGSSASPPAAALPDYAEATPQTDASIPARSVTMIGATPEEPGAPGSNETWGVGVPGGAGGETAGQMLVRYTTSDGWTLAGALPAGFKLDPTALAAQMTPTGAGVLVGTVPGATGHPSQRMLVRSPGGSFATPAEAPPLKEGEALFGVARTPLIAALDEGGHVGALAVPVSEEASGAETTVLHWEGRHWQREPIALPSGGAEGFRVLAIGASSPANAWLLAELSPKSHAAGAVALFRRVPKEGASGQWIWEPAAPSPAKGDTEAHPLMVPVDKEGKAEEAPLAVAGAGQPPTSTAQLLTVTSEGVWVDGERADVHAVTPASTTIFFKPDGEAAAGGVAASWCHLPPSAPAQTPGCDHELPEALPSGPSRSIAWGDASAADPYGERVITGLAEGVSLRLEGSEFTPVLALGATAGDTPGAALGAAFSSATEGWLGSPELPIHLTREHLEPSRLTPWPVPFRHALIAIAPQPGAPIGALSSEALAVGDQGEVARYKPGEGWLPESLFGPGERVETPRLRAVAWPRQNRAYAVGDGGEMWLWRGETGLWEHDPATPPNFRANLLGVAFDPVDPARGYAVGSTELELGGVLLRYGKTWTEETALPAQVQGASFTSIAFAGSEAIVAYRKLINPERREYTGGLLVEDGLGWQVEASAATVIGANAPLAVAGLPDGGAAFSTFGPEGTRVFEREAAGAPWQPTPVPPTNSTASSLALFREGGGPLRAVVANGSADENYEEESEPPSPAGFPPNLIGAFPVGESGPTSGLLRQSATGWNDESHELNPAGQPEGDFVFYDLPYRPEPVLAVLVGPSGGEGWAVGGEVHQETNLDAASIERYPADGVAPLGESSGQVAVAPGTASFAIAGGAQCAADCTDRALARIGPDVWLSAALAHARQIGVRAFLYTGPRLTKDEATGPVKPSLPYKLEFERYASLLTAELPAYAAPSPQDLDARPEALGDERLFERAFADCGKPASDESANGACFPRPFGNGSPAPGLPPAPEARLDEGPNKPQEETEREQCFAEAGCEGAYYALESEGAAGSCGGPANACVRVIVLDDTREVAARQREWLERQLAGARRRGEPAIVIGNAALNAQIEADDVPAKAVAQALVCGGASAYFYDAPEENVMKPLSTPGCSGSIPTFGSGTLGYVNVKDESAGDFHGASGFLLAEVDLAAYDALDAREKENNANRAKLVTARLIPNVGELALEAKDGTLLRRSEPALFQALARRPRAGSRAESDQVPAPEVDPYIPIPSNCVGSPECASGFLLPTYTFTSSRPNLGGFVVRNLNSSNPHAVLDNSRGEPIPDEPRNPKGELTPDGKFEENSKHEPINERGEVVPAVQSGLFCAYNASANPADPATIVTIGAGGRSSSLPVVVQAGSVREPCGTVPLKEVRVSPQVSSAPPPPPAPAPAPAGAAPAPAPVPPLPPPPAIPPASAPPAPAVRAVPPPPFFAVPAAVLAPAAFVPPPLPPAANPTPPSGTSAVTSPVEAAQKEEEEEEATESVSNQAVAYRVSEHEPSPAYLIGIVILAAFAGASSARRRPRRGRRELPVAPATLTGARAQRIAAGPRVRR